MPIIALPKTLTAHTDAVAADVMADLNKIVELLNGQIDLENLAATLRAGLFQSGDLKATGAAAPPEGWLLCDGSAVSRTTYAALFAKLGVAFGAGNGATTFNLPDLRGRIPVGVDGGAGRINWGTLANKLGQAGGHQMLQAHAHHLSGAGAGTSIESVVHSHFLGWFGGQVRHEGTGFAYGTNVEVGGGTNTATESAFHTHALVGDTQSEGLGDQQNLQPYQVVNWLVKI